MRYIFRLIQSKFQTIRLGSIIIIAFVQLGQVRLGQGPRQARAWGSALGAVIPMTMAVPKLKPNLSLWNAAACCGIFSALWLLFAESQSFVIIYTLGNNMKTNAKSSSECACLHCCHQKSTFELTLTAIATQQFKGERQNKSNIFDRCLAIYTMGEKR